MLVRVTSRAILILLVLGLSACSTVPLMAADEAEAKGNVNIDELEKEWNALVAKRDKLTKKLQVLSEEYGTLVPSKAKPKGGDPKRLAAIEQEMQTSIDDFNSTVTPRMEAILPTLAKAKYKVYLNNPKDEKAEEIVFSYMQMSYAAKQRYGEVAAIGKKLIEKGIKHPMALNLTGASLFCTDQFAEAKQVLEMAADDKSEMGQGIFSEVGHRFLVDCDDYIKYWDRESKLREQETAAPEAMQNPHVLLTTTKGDVEIELFENQAPNTVANFISLVEKGKYDNVGFHRVLPDFMAQGGDPNTLNKDPNDDGQGGPGYTIKCECNRKDARMHFVGSLSMAHAGEDTGGSQFFITYMPATHLNGKHTVFGRVIKGMDVVRKFEQVQPGEPTGKEMDRIVSAKVLNKRNHEYVPETAPERVRRLN